MADCPCRGCAPPKRNMKCHSECKEYKKWKENLPKNNNTEYEIEGYMADKVRRLKK